MTATPAPPWATARPNACMVLAAGLGARMRPLSSVLPKPALPLPTGPVVTSTLRLAHDSATRVVVNSHHLGHVLEAEISRLPDGLAHVEYSRETELMDTAGGLALARERGLLGTAGPVLVLNGDCVLNLDLEALIDRHAASRDLVTLALLPHLNPMRWSRVGLDGSGTVTTIRPAGELEAGELPFLYTGAMIVARAALDRLPTAPSGIWDRLWRPAMHERRLGGVVVTGHWREVGTPEAYLETALQQLRGQAKIEDSAAVADSAILGTALIGDRATVAEDSVVAEAVVSHGARIGRGARVIRSVLLGPVSIAAGETVVNEFRTAPLSP